MKKPLNLRWNQFVIWQQFSSSVRKDSVIAEFDASFMVFPNLRNQLNVWLSNDTL